MGDELYIHTMAYLLEQELIKKNRNFLLILDNSAAHKCFETLSNIEIKFLPKNAPVNFQPLELGVIRPLKCQF